MFKKFFTLTETTNERRKVEMLLNIAMVSLLISISFTAVVVLFALKEN
jgi:hypothetical protein